MVSAARSIPSSSWLDDARHEQRRAGVEQDDVAPAAGLAAQDRLDVSRAFSSGVAAGQPCASPRA